MEKTLDIKRPKLLVADDSVTVRKVIELTFAEEGVDVFAVGDGEAAMKTFVEVEPDIVLADVNMPDPTGYHICEMIKLDDTTKDIPVILLVGSFEPFDQTEAERVGADGFLTKPFQSVRELVSRVTELLNDGNGIPVAPADTADIQNLYENSFAESYRTDNEVRSNTFLGDAGMDDDLIETVYREGGPERVVIADDVRDAEMQGYDWMAQPVVNVNEPTSVNGDRNGAPSQGARLERIVDDFDDTLEVEEPEPKSQAETAEEPASQIHLPQPADVQFPVAAPPAEADSFQALELDGPAIRYQPPEVEEAITVETPPESDRSHEVEEPTQGHPQDADAPMLELHSYQAREIETPVAPPLQISDPPQHHDVEPAAAVTTEQVDEQAAPFSGGASEELINAIAARVIEKLSDQAVRDIARETVPRITEKLIREALDPDNNKPSQS